MRVILFCALFFISSVYASSQNLIGLKYDEIRIYMRTNYRELNFNKVTNREFNYMKYSNSSDNETVLFFLGPDSVCKSVRIIFDQNLKLQKMAEMDSLYRKSGRSRWLESKNGNDFVFELKDEDWASVITITQKK